MRTLIVSKTKMQHGICVGGLLPNGTNVRLLNANGYNQNTDCPYNIGDIWDLTYINRQNLTSPHSEDVLISKAIYVGHETNLLQVLNNHIGIEIWWGDPSTLFDNLIQWTGKGSGFIAQRTGVPNKSVGFFKANCDLILEDDRKHYKFQNASPFISTKKLSYVGLQSPLDLIPRGTLIRVSLARWWKPEDVDLEERCYAQLSGWYD